jgi:hypothetical protein
VPPEWWKGQLIGLTHINTGGRKKIRTVRSRPSGITCEKIHVLPASPRSGSENRDGLRNVVQNLVQLRAEKAPISPLGSSLLH